MEVLPVMPSTGFATASTPKSPSSSNLELRSFIARLRASLDNLDEGEFTEGHELDPKTGRRVPKEMIGRRLAQGEAKRVLARLE